MASKSVLIVVGSENDVPKVQPAADVLGDLGVAFELRVASAHRTPKRAVDLSSGARDRGVGVVIAAAGLAAHLPGVVAAHTTLPVIALPIAAGTLGGVDALLSGVQMPPGIPVASVGIDAGRNAGILAAEILGVGDRRLAARIGRLRARAAKAVEAADGRIRRAGR